MITSIRKEIAISSKYGNDKRAFESIETIYFGGGTPSLIKHKNLDDIMMAIRENFSVNEDAEITLEANPDDIFRENLTLWKHCGINRLSIGIQSFREEDLLWVNRSHTAAKAFQSLTLVKEAGFDNFSVDLIYGIPGLSDSAWKENVSHVIRANVPHIACYALTVEPKTALQKMIALKKKADVCSEDQARQFSLLMRWLRKAGYEHYEISNFAWPGFRSRHNSSYWQGKSYYGFGPSAHSFDGNKRSWNIANNTRYINALRKNEVPSETEYLSYQDKVNEYIMISLRTIEGLDLQFVQNQFSVAERIRIEKTIQPYLKSKLMKGINEAVVLTDKGKLFADGIAADLFIISD
jgi:putative oxygen-independent coproporphyrinogen III oxidase